jgi:hypothetical protein
MTQVVAALSFLLVVPLESVKEPVEGAFTGAVRP